MLLNLFKKFFYSFIVKPAIYFCLGLNVRGGNNLPKKGPCIIIANHNSHLDTLVLISMFSGKTILKISPVAASDYFLRNKILAWISLNLFNIIPLNRKVSKSEQERFNNLLNERIQNDGIIIIYPEGTRGEPEKMTTFKAGIAHIAKMYPEVPVIPVYMEGLGMALPRSEAFFVPAICTIVVESPIYYKNNKDEFMNELKNIYEKMQKLVVKEEI